MNTALHVRRITAQEVRILRTAILRPNLPPGSHIFPGDTAPDTYHSGAFMQGDLVGVASVFREGAPFAEGAISWRLRGMAVAEAARRSGCGRALVLDCLGYISQQGGDLVWCHGRTSAMPFYSSLGFQAHGDEFEVPVSGPHYTMWRPVHEPDNQ